MIVESRWRITQSLESILLIIFHRLVRFEVLEFWIGLHEYVIWKDELQKVAKDNRIYNKSEA